MSCKQSPGMQPGFFFYLTENPTADQRIILVLQLPVIYLISYCRKAQFQAEISLRSSCSADRNCSDPLLLSLGPEYLYRTFE
jgi:hypothetical protein